MRLISASNITEVVEKLCIDSNYFLNDDILTALKTGILNEESDIGKEVLSQLVQNAQIAKDENMAICQDTGMAVVFVELGQEAHVVDGNITDAINEGVRRGYKKGFLRNSIVEDPIYRKNTGDNTPAVVHFNIVPGENMKICVAPKGFGSENMSAMKMLKPSDGIEGVKKFILDTIQNAGSNACPPMVVGVGIGGNSEKAAILAKKALLRPIDIRSNIKYIQELEKDLFEGANNLGIGPAGLGGRITALAVNIETFPTHIAGLPVAVCISCHATRHAEMVI